jgi:hypothetical protein
MATKTSRVKQEQLRKRRNNLLRRHNDFWRLFSIRSWLTMEMPNGRIYTYHSHPDVPVPTVKEMVSFLVALNIMNDSKTLQNTRSRPAVHRTPADYVPEKSTKLTIPKAPTSSLPKRQNAVWGSFARYNIHYSAQHQCEYNTLPPHFAPNTFDR